MYRTRSPSLLLVWTSLVYVTYCLGRDSLPPLGKYLTKMEIWADHHRKEGLKNDPEIYMNATQLITSKGFPCENYYVTTEDGYILNLLRIPHGREKTQNKGARPVVLLQHGLLGSCTHFLSNPVNESLAYILAEAGAEVWLANSRGNFYSCNHTRLNPSQEEFWKFSFDEMGKYDVPAVVNFVVSTSGVDQIYFVGHSQGTTIGFIAFSRNPQVAAHIKHFIALAPVARVGHTESPIKYLAPYAKEIEKFLALFGHGQLEVDPTIMRFLAGTLCEKWGSILCSNFLFLLCGFDNKSFNMSRVPVYVAHNPSSTSVWDIMHWAQAVNSNKFQQFDYGSPAENMAHYNQTSPPLYDPSQVRVPIAVFRGGHDWLADPADVGWLLTQINVTLDVNVDRYEHLDFIWAVDAPTLIYKKLLQLVFT